MDDPFLRSRQALASDGARGWLLAAGVVATLLLAWGAWFSLARLAVYAISSQARLEAVGAAQRVQAQAEGRVVARRVELGDSVTRDQVLFEIDSQVERSILTQKEINRESAEAERGALEEQLQRARDAQAERRRAARAALQEARAQLQESETAANYARGQADRIAGLHENGLVSESERSEAEAEAAQRAAAVDRDRQAVSRREAELQAEEQAGEAELAALQRDLQRLRGTEQETGAALVGLGELVEQRTVRAPIDGRIAEIAELRPGAFVEAGDHLATVVPVGEVAVVAQFAPGEALGRVRPGQTARLRLEGFSWMRYGALTAVVTRVASEARSGGVRVEATLSDAALSEIPLEHGLPGVLEVEVERISPAALALRAAGRMLRPPRGGPGAGRDARPDETDREG